MAIQFSAAVRNARLDAIETAIGNSPSLRLYTGSPPADCTLVPTGTLLATLTLPADWNNDASGGTKTIKNGPWTGTAVAAGTAGYFRVYSSGGTCHMQGTVGQGSGDLSFDNAVFGIGQTINVVSFTFQDANA